MEEGSFGRRGPPDRGCKGPRTGWSLTRGRSWKETREAVPHASWGRDREGLERGRGQGWISCREYCRRRELWRTADRWCSLVTKWVLAPSAAALHRPPLLRQTGVQGPWSLSPQPAPARPPPTLPTSEAPRSRTVCCKPRNVPQSARRDVGGQREAGDPVERQSRAKLGPWGQRRNC